MKGVCGSRTNFKCTKKVFEEKNKKVVQKAISHVRILKSNDKFSFLELKPITGRKHQLRKQLYYIGNPIVGDNKYFGGIQKGQFKKQDLMNKIYFVDVIFPMIEIKQKN